MNDQFPGSFFGPPTLVALLRHRARHQPQDRTYTFLVDGESEEVALTNAQLDAQARAIAAHLQKLGLAGERALMLYPPGLEFIAAFFGCLYAGVIAVPAYPPRMNRSLYRIQTIASDADARVALTTAGVWERVQPMLAETPDLQRVCWIATDQLDLQAADDWRPPQIGVDSLAVLQYTSGSTGIPKGVMLSHGNLLHNSALISHAFEHTRSGTGVFWLPSYHDMGLIGGILQPLYVGRPNVLMSPMAFLQRPLRWLQAITRYRGTTSGGPNFAYELCVNKITPQQCEELDLSSWRVAFNGAEPIRAETLDRFTEMFSPCGFRREAFYPCYGLAEATLIATGGYKDDPPRILHVDARELESDRVVPAAEMDPAARPLVGCGHCLPDQQLVIVDPATGHQCAEGEVGEIWIQGPSVAGGYWNRPEETEQTFRARVAGHEGTFLRTGDLGFLRDGELYVTGRLKDLIIVHGLNHYPQDIEYTVEKCHEALRDGNCAAFTIEQSGKQRLVIVAEVDRRARDQAAEAISAIRRAVSTAHELVVDAVALIRAGSIPKTSSGKIQRHACRRAFLDGTLTVVAQWPQEGGQPEDAIAARPSTTAAEANDGAALYEPASNRMPGRPTAPSAGNGRGGTALPAAPRNGPAANGNGAAGSNHGASRAASAAPQRTAGVTAREVAPSGNGAPQGSTGPLSFEDACRGVLEEVRRIAPERGAELSLDMNWSDIGFDSLQRIELQAALEDRFGGRIPEDVAPELQSLREVAQAVQRYLGGPAAASRSIDEIPPEDYRIECFPECVQIRESIEWLRASGLHPYFSVHQGVTRDTTCIDGRQLVNFASYNYVGLSGDPRVTRAAQQAVERFGTSVSASRLVSGEKPLHGELERAIAEMIGTDDALVFVGGHATNESVVGHLVGPGDLVLHDALAHNSLLQGARLSGARRRSFPHNDADALDRLLRELRGQFRRVLVLIESVYSMDGDIADLPRFVEIKQRHKALLMVDEAHSIGVLGATGRGIAQHFDLDPCDVDLWMGTLSKALASCGGYIAGSRALVEYLKYTAPGFVYSVGMSPANAAAALEAIRVLREEPQRVRTLRQRSELFLRLARQQGLNTGTSAGTPIVPVILGNSLMCLQLSRAMFRRGVNVQPILYPAVDERSARLRFFITCCHSESQIRDTVQMLAEELAALQPQGNSNPVAAIGSLSQQPPPR